MAFQHWEVIKERQGPRYYIDERAGCTAILDSWHPFHQKHIKGEHNGLSEYDPDVKKHIGGDWINGNWNIPEGKLIRYASDERHTELMRLLAQHFCDEEFVLSDREIGDIIKNTDDGIIDQVINVRNKRDQRLDRAMHNILAF